MSVASLSRRIVTGDAGNVYWRNDRQQTIKHVRRTFQFRLIEARGGHPDRPDQQVPRARLAGTTEKHYGQFTRESAFLRDLVMPTKSRRKSDVGSEGYVRPAWVKSRAVSQQRDGFGQSPLIGPRP